MGSFEIPAAYNLLCADVGLAPASVPDGVRDLLTADLEAARFRLAEAGIPVTADDPDAGQTLVMFAAWLYRGRVADRPMPMMLRQAIRDRQVADATGGAAGDL